MSKYFKGKVNGQEVSDNIVNGQVYGMDLTRYLVDGEINGVKVYGYVIDGKINGIPISDRSINYNQYNKNSQYRQNVNSTNNKIKEVTKELKELNVDISSNQIIKDADDSISIYSVVLGTLGLGTLIVLCKICGSSIDNIIKFIMFGGLSSGAVGMLISKNSKEKLDELKRILSEHKQKDK